MNTVSDKVVRHSLALFSLTHRDIINSARLELLLFQVGSAQSVVCDSLGGASSSSAINSTDVYGDQRLTSVSVDAANVLSSVMTPLHRHQHVTAVTSLSSDVMTTTDCRG